ncbi:WD-REPEATS-REGION domain-containing protein [Mycena chlorophos]|uniref:WD-REPEATS-REGION domain-containing protein n=1 Tax=Mycena chlorophos TaxID=658473 RepID=A0A8H6T078_MYCCL|nr:WD-REPEATS-REGION domain-containing protein [Mycena chlorophos]
MFRLASIKLWSLATQRCLHTFTHHADSVWSLFSSHPLLETFFAGDRSGIVSRVDVSRLNTDVGEGECVLVCREGEDGAAGGSPQGQGQGGINKLVVADDSLVWTATSSSSVRRWRIPARNNANTTPGATASYKDYDYTSTLERDGRSLAPSVLSYEGDEGDDGEGETRHGISYASLVRLQSPIDPYPIRSARDPEVATLYSAASVVSVPALRSPPLLSSTSQHIGSPMRTAPLPNSRGAYFNRELAAEAQPLVPMPDAVGTIAGERGLVRALVLNDRVHAVSIDTSGEVAVWDLVRGICVGAIPSDVAAAGTKQSSQEWSPREALELVRERLEGEAVVASWATVDTKSGVLAVHINERSFESEIYADEVGYSGDRRFSDETKFNIGKWVLRNLFLGFIREEIPLRRSIVLASPAKPLPDTEARPPQTPVVAVTPAAASTPMGTSPLLTPMIPLPVRAKDLIPLPPIVGSPTIASNDATPMPQPNRRPKTGENNGKEGDYFASRPRHTSIQNGAVTPGADDFSGWAGPGAQTPNTPTSLMGRLKSFGKKRVLEAATPSLPPTVETPTAQETVPDPATKTPVQQLLSGPLSPPSSSEAPTLGISPHILLLIEEEAEPAFKTVYRGTVGSTGSSGDIHALEEAMPLWLIEYLLLHRMPSTPPQVKLSFVLLPWVDKENREDQLPELLNTTQSKLTASRSLRVRKLLLHVQEKLDKLDPPPPDIVRPRPEELFEILCNDVVLPLDMSIAAVRHAKMCASCREKHRSYGEAKRARRKAEKALIIGLADGSLPGPAPKPSEPQKPLLEQYPELLASLTEEERVKQNKKRAARTPSSSVAAIAGPSTIPGWAIDPSLFNQPPRASSALAGALGNEPVDMLHPAAATPSGLELESPVAPRYCSVKNCKIIILDTLEDYPYKMCRSCRDRYRGYGITKRKKSKASRADHDKELEAKLVREDERRAKDGLLPLAQCPEDLAAYQKSLVDAQAAAPPPHQALAHGKIAVPMPPPDPKFSRASADSNRPALRVCSVSHCHKILLSSYKYKRCETHRQQGRWHGLIKRGRDKVQKGIWAEDGTVLIEPGPIKLNKEKGKDKAAESEDAQDNGLEDADTSLEPEEETVSVKPRDKDRAICKKDGCCNFILPGSRWRTCSSCKAKASRAKNPPSSDIHESSLPSVSLGPSAQNPSAAIASETTSALTVPARPLYSGPQLVPYPGPAQPFGYSPFAPLTGHQPMFFIPVAAQPLQYYSLPSAAERAAVPPATDEPGAVHSRPDANDSAVSRPAKRRRVSGQRDPGQWIAAISTPKGGVIDFNTPPAIVHSSCNRSAAVVPQNAPEEGPPDALPSPPAPAADVAPLDRDVHKTSSAPRRECGSLKCRRTIPAGVGGSRCQRCLTKLKRRHDATKQRYHLEPKKGPQLPHRSS